MKTYCTSLLALAALGWLASPAAADTIQLRNGDRLNGKVLEVTETHVKLESEIQGIFKLPRDKLVGIVIGDPHPQAPAQRAPAARAGQVPRAGGAAPGSVDDILDRMLPKNFDQQTVRDLGAATGAAGGTVDEVIEQLRTEGVDPQLMSDLNLMLPGFSSPGVQGYFNDRVNGLIDGSLSIHDIRRDAADALDGYLGILEGFLQSTAPAAPRFQGAKQPEKTPAQPAKPARPGQPAERP